MKVVRFVPGGEQSPSLLGAVLVRDLTVGGERWTKGRRLSTDDLARLCEPTALAEPDEGRAARPLTLLVLDPTDVHEDDAALRLARAVAAPDLVLRGPNESRVDLLAPADGILHVNAEAIERLDRIDPLQVFCLYDGQAVRAGDVVASVKVGPHAVEASVLERGESLSRTVGPLVRVAPFVHRTAAALVKEAVRPLVRERFESSVRAKVESLGSTLSEIRYVADEEAAVAAALGELIAGGADLVLTAGGASTDPLDPFFVAIDRLGGSVVRHGVPAHPGSMVWLARIGRTDLLGLPTCGAYSKATAADLLLPRLLTGERASAAMAAPLGVGGLLTRSMRFRFPPYARELDAPEG